MYHYRIWLTVLLVFLCARPTQADQPSHLWSKMFVGTYYDYPNDVVVDAWGDIIIAGSFSEIPEVPGEINFGGITHWCQGEFDIFVAKFDPDGNYIWSKSFGSDGEEWASAVAVDDSGNIILVGYFLGAVNFGGGSLYSSGYDVFVAKFSPNGNHIWSKRFGDAANDWGKSVAVDASGNIAVSGHFYGTIDFGGGTLTSAGGADIFIAKFDPDGNHLWSKRFGDAEYESGSLVAVGGSGGIVISGVFRGGVDFGGGVLTSEGENDIFLAKLAPGGGHIWSQRFGDSNTQQDKDLAVDGSESVVITGYFEDSIDFGGGTLTSAGEWDVYLAKFDSSGIHQWSQRFGDSYSDYPDGLDAGDPGNIVLSGHFTHNIDFGGDVLASAGNFDIFTAGFNSSGDHIWSQRYGDSNGQYADAVATGGAGELVILGDFYGTVDFGGGPLTASGATDIYLAKFSALTVDVQDLTIPCPITIRAYPNPFNPLTTINFILPWQMNASLVIYNALGEHVKLLARGELEPGPNEFRWDGTNDLGTVVGSGTYFCVLEAGGHVSTRKLVLTK